MPNDPPYTHNLVKLSTECGLAEKMSEEQNSFIDGMMPLNIEARYPEYKEKMLKQLSAEQCEKILNYTIELQLWIREQLSK
ncbi:MAG: HEPN domain-containing protein [Bacteroidaceae bacterium]|nr:HEPN domain-containing protein [Bacteroidaceae bacterium]